MTIPLPMPRPDTSQPEFNVSPITAPQPEPMEVDTSPQSITPTNSPEVLEKRAFKVKYGLDEILNKTKDEIYAGLQQGDEPQLRQQAAAEIDKRKSVGLQSLIAQTIQNKGSALTPEETGGLTSIIMNMSKQTDPATVFEEAYGKQFIATLDRTAMAKPDNFLNDAKQKFPEETAAILNDHGSLVTKREIIGTYLEDVEDELNNQSYLPWLYNQSEELIPGYSDIRLRGLGPRTGVFAGGTLGENLDKTRIELLRLPTDQLLPALQKIVEPMRKGNTYINMGNPTLAADFLRSMLGMSTNDVILKDITLPLDVAGLGLGKATVRGIRGVLPKTEAQLLRDTKTAAEDMAKASADPGVSKSTMEAAACDLEQSAITRATANSVGEAHGITDPRKRALDSLSDVFRTDLEDIKARQ